MSSIVDPIGVLIAVSSIELIMSRNSQAKLFIRRLHKVTIIQVCTVNVSFSVLSSKMLLGKSLYLARDANDLDVSQR